MNKISVSRSKLILWCAVLLLGVIGLFAYKWAAGNAGEKMRKASADRAIEAKRASSANGDLDRTSVASTSKGASNEGMYETAAKATADAMQELLRMRSNPTPEAIHRLASLLEGNDEAVAAEAIDTLSFLAEQGVEPDQCLAILLGKAKDKDFPQRGLALLAAAGIGGDKTLPVIEEYLKDKSQSSSPDADVQQFASRALALVSTPACVPYLSAILTETSNEATRSNCYEVLAKIRTPEAIAVLQQQIESGSGKDQAAAVLALSRIGDDQAISSITNGILGGQIKQDALKSLCLSPAAPDVFGALLYGKNNSDENKVGWLKDLDQYGIYASKDVRSRMTSTITPLLDSADKEVKLEAISAIGAIGGTQGADLIFPYLYSDDQEVRRTTFFAHLPFANPSNYHYLFDFLSDEDQETRRTAMGIAERFVNRNDRALLEEASRSSDAFIRERALNLLAQLN